MDYHPPLKLMEEVEAASKKKAGLDVGRMLVKGFMSGALLAYGTALAYKVSGGFGDGAAALVAGAVFPVGFAMIILLGMELATGNFAVLPVGVLRGKVALDKLFRNWGWVYLGNFFGCVFVGFLLAIALTEAFIEGHGPLGDKIIAVAISKTLVYEHAGANGWVTAFVKGILCNWMVALGTILGMISTSATGKIAAIWLPVSTFFALGFEHSVVNMFIMPTAILLGADITVGQWIFWNQIPVTLGNIVGGTVFTGMLLHYSYKPAPPAPAEEKPVHNVTQTVP
ncbi:formate/nitrite transporter family protein [Nitrosovibrio sp. Nv6]|uniref:formate/nitrite transporter family protein n=1 Tax=Nitrosovibrio sp. Nv6 TaxID=1855340 RepID=UPI0008D6D93C|nr:formate/nitrite transporter family protein [Nitrosovibrio sp. Nv6]SEP41414.1 formate/nitrite transporter [Nitrosovibrio sp. Nv6]